MATAPGGVPVPFDMPSRTFPVLPGAVDHELVEQITRSLKQFVGFCLSDLGHGANNHLVTSEFIHDLLGDLEKAGVPLPESLHLRWLQRLDGNRIACDIPGFLDAVARNLVAPRSPVIARLPSFRTTVESNAEQAQNRFFDLVGSVPAGGRALIWGRLRERGIQQRTKSVKRTMGWWNDWHDSLLSDAADIRLDFLSTGFELGQSMLGDGILGGAGGESSSDPSIRYSVPL